MWLFLSLLGLFAAIRVIEHTPFGNGGIGIASHVKPESTWLIVIRDSAVDMTNTESDAFLSRVKDALKQDACSLFLSKTSSRFISLRIHCPMVFVTDLDGDGKEEEVELDSPRLVHTEAFLLTLFNSESFSIARNSPYAGPSKGGAPQLGYHIEKASDEEALYESQDTQMIQERASWHLDRIDRRAGVFNGLYTYRNDARDVDIYVLDTGILASHVEFEGRATFLHNALRDKLNSDCNGHGTHVAGIAASRTFGVAKKAQVFGVRVLNCSGQGILDDILEGIDVIIDSVIARAPRRAVINLSLGGEKNILLDAAVDSLRAHGLVVVLAAGNEESDACEASPSNMGRNNYVLTVGASDHIDRRPWWSNYGECVTVSAPGVDIPSTWFTSNTASATLDGTSMAAPVVSGVVAMILQENPLLSVNEVNEMLIQWATPKAISSTTKVGGGSSLVFSLVDPSIPLTELAPLPSPPPPFLSSSGNGELPSYSMILCIAVTLLYFACLA